MATLETQYKNWLKENEPITYSEWLEKFSEIHHLDKLKEPTMITDWLNEHGDPEITKKVEKEAEILILLSEIKEAAESKYGIGYGAVDSINAFIEGAKWQQERSYSEEDMAESFMACWKANIPEGFECKLAFNEWFEQFKKK